jgi:hypothetical protein
MLATECIVRRETPIAESNRQRCMGGRVTVFLDIHATEVLGLVGYASGSAVTD